VCSQQVEVREAGLWPDVEGARDKIHSVF
jgi:hypothetical protein